MTLFIRDNLSILFLHAPKCGGSSVAELFSANGFSPQLQMRGLPAQDCLHASPQHQTSATLKSLINIEKLDDIFILVRNPYERIKSEYRWSFRDTPRNIQPDFNEWVLRSLELAHEDPWHQDNHFRPAIDFIDISMPCRIFKLEEGIEMIAEFYMQGGRAINSAHKFHEKDSSRFSNKPLELDFSDASLSAINHFYKHDFSAFGYQMVNEPNKNLAPRANKESNICEHYDKVNAISGWREETLILLQGKLTESIERLDLDLKRKNSRSINDAIQNTIRTATSSSFMDEIYDDTLLRLESLRDVLELLNSPLPSSNCAERLQYLISIINKYQVRLLQEPTE